MTHVARGVDAEGTLTVDVIMRGQVPEVPENVHVTVLPYTEQYIQTGPGPHHLLCVSVSVCVSESLVGFVYLPVYFCIIYPLLRLISWNLS